MLSGSPIDSSSGTIKPRNNSPGTVNLAVVSKGALKVISNVMVVPTFVVPSAGEVETTENGWQIEI